MTVPAVGKRTAARAAGLEESEMLARVKLSGYPSCGVCEQRACLPAYPR